MGALRANCVLCWYVAKEARSWCQYQVGRRTGMSHIKNRNHCLTMYSNTAARLRSSRPSRMLHCINYSLLHSQGTRQAPPADRPDSDSDTGQVADWDEPSPWGSLGESRPDKVDVQRTIGGRAEAGSTKEYGACQTMLSTGSFGHSHAEGESLLLVLGWTLVACSEASRLDAPDFRYADPTPTTTINAQIFKFLSEDADRVVRRHVGVRYKLRDEDDMLVLEDFDKPAGPEKLVLSPSLFNILGMTAIKNCRIIPRPDKTYSSMNAEIRLRKINQVIELEDHSRPVWDEWHCRAVYRKLVTKTPLSSALPSKKVCKYGHCQSTFLEPDWHCKELQYCCDIGSSSQTRNCACSKDFSYMINEFLQMWCCEQVAEGMSANFFLSYKFVQQGWGGGGWWWDPAHL